MDFAGRYPWMRSSTKRTHTEMAASHREPAASSSSLFIPHDDHYDNEHTARRPRLTLPSMRASPAPRFAGDGFDYRRPIMSSGTPSAAAAPVIDLTEDDNLPVADMRTARRGSVQPAAGASRASRLPRFGGRDILDVSGDMDADMTAEHDEDLGLPPPRSTARPQFSSIRLRPQLSGLRRPSRFGRIPTPQPRSGGEVMDDDLEIVSERALSRQPSPAPVQRSFTPFVGERQNNLVDLTEDDDVVLLSARVREGSGVNAARPGMTAGVATMDDEYRAPGIGGLVGMLRQGGRLAHRLGLAGDLDDRRFIEPFAQRHRVRLAQVATFPAPYNFNAGGGGAVGGMPGAMMYEDPGFDLGLQGGNRPASPKYEPPLSPGVGFTRNPSEDEVVVCPNCGDELAVGESDDKQEVWVVKTCGHAYCGLCAKNRVRKAASKARPKGKGKGKEKETEDNVILPPAFQKCVVEGCGKTVKGPSTMVHVYFGS
ncbi:hypothetical protein LTR97_003034 [Elasticomyces elasticus]|uniref:RING-type domain-containing protein n=1 Tax=Elasticomyces elasticus TaxID=574655 RepID=A0AAN7ZPS3_9PEZI|nr:hypothetical protein LTR97_003034 [Elasticomyces elasticus]KAK5725771.1 hypothetical protein LTR15_003961 [Elasticomyces elasticus]